MNFFKRIFSRKKNNSGNEDENSVPARRRDVDFDNPEQRSRYVMDCIEQMEDSSREVEILTGEYQLVTDYLTDTEEIEALPDVHKEKIEAIARQLLGYAEDMRRYREKENRMSDIDYYTLRKQESEVEEGIHKLRESERYARLIKKDLRRLDGERQACEFRKNEIKRSMSNYKGMVSIFIVAYIFCMLLLLFFQFVMGMSVFIGYILATAVAAIACTVSAVKYIDSDKERTKTAGEINKLIKLQNTVKIRYVNNRRLLEYLYLKYHVENAEKLERLWREYKQEKEERRQFIEAEAQNEFYSKQLVSILSNYRVMYPDRWIFQVQALLDRREMVEIRHELIKRRQRVREQMDYNKKLNESARNELGDIAGLYPEYAREILEMVDRAASPGDGKEPSYNQ